MKRGHHRSYPLIACVFVAMALDGAGAMGEDARGLGLSFEFGLDLSHPPLECLAQEKFGFNLPLHPLQAFHTSIAAVDTAARPRAAPAVRLEETGIRFGAGELREPVGIAVDPIGFVYVADAMAGKVFRYEIRREEAFAASRGSSSGVPSLPDSSISIGPALEFARPPDAASFYPIDVAVQESFVLVLDYARNRLLRYDYRGAYYDVLVSFAERGALRPVSVTAGSGGRLVTTDVEASEVVLWTPLLDVEVSLGGFGSAPGSFGAPRKAAFLPDQRFVVVESGNARLQEFSPSGRFERIVPPPDGGFLAPRSVASDGRGAFFVCDPEAKRLAVYAPDLSGAGGVDSFAGERIVPAAVAAGWDGSLYVADLASRSIVVYRIVYPEGR